MTKTEKKVNKLYKQLKEQDKNLIITITTILTLMAKEKRV